MVFFLPRRFLRFHRRFVSSSTPISDHLSFLSSSICRLTSFVSLFASVLLCRSIVSLACLISLFFVRMSSLNFHFCLFLFLLSSFCYMLVLSFRSSLILLISFSMSVLFFSSDGRILFIFESCCVNLRQLICVVVIGSCVGVQFSSSKKTGLSQN